jgi:hypothetical protein
MSYDTPEIKFSEDWDKLSAPIFTTIRSWREDKERYYRELVDHRFAVVRVRNLYTREFSQSCVAQAVLESVEVVAPNELAQSVLEEDVRIKGVPDEKWLRKLRGMDAAILLRFRRL